MNPIEMIKGLLAKGNTPQKIVENMVGNSNPIISNLINMARYGNTDELMKFGENLYRSNGKDPNSFKKDLDAFIGNFK